MASTVDKTCECGGEFEFNSYCGAYVCVECDNHKGLARCYCGWSQSGRNGRLELEEMGETLEPDDYYYDDIGPWDA